MDSNYPMEIFLTCAGFILGISAFLYLTSFIDSGRRKMRSLDSGNKKERTTKMGIPANKKATNRPNPPMPKSSIPHFKNDALEKMPERMCPMCGKILTRDEPLYATHMDIGKDKKVFIHGCPYCYKSKK